MSDALPNYLLENMKSANSAAGEEIRQVKAGAGRLFRLTITNLNAAARFAYVFDSASADAGALLIPPMSLAPGASLDLTWGYGKQFANGMRIHASSSQGTFTASGTADFMSATSFI